MRNFPPAQNQQLIDMHIKGASNVPYMIENRPRMSKSMDQRVLRPLSYSGFNQPQMTTNMETINNMRMNQPNISPFNMTPQIHSNGITVSSQVSNRPTDFHSSKVQPFNAPNICRRQVEVDS